MAQFTFELPNNLSRVPIAEERSHLEYEGETYAVYGEEVWFKGKIKLDQHEYQDYTKIKIQAEIQSDQDLSLPQSPHSHSRIGVWIPVRDSRIETRKIRAKQWRCVFDGDDCEFAITGQTWKFGKLASVEIKPAEMWQGELECLVCLNPCFSNVHDDSFKINFNVVPYKGTTPFEQVDISTVEVRRDDKWPHGKTAMSDLIEQFDQFGAFETEGIGNSLHPKQLLTVEAVKHQLNNSKNPVTLCYIGPDTTENICSMLRSINEDASAKEKLNGIYIYSYKEWDEEILDDFGVLESNIQESGLKPKFERLSKTTNVEPIAEEVIVVATYVTPWATNTENKQTYANLLSSLLCNKNSKLVTVDPKSGDFIARSWLNSEMISLEEFYETELNLSPDIVRDLKYETTIATIWSQTGGSN